MHNRTEPNTAHKIAIAKPTFYGDELDQLQAVLTSGWVSQGPTVQRFEDDIAQYCGAKYAVGMSSWTTAMHAGLLLQGIGPGDDVICPSYSFIATANVVKHAGATPIFADIDPETLNLCPTITRELITTCYRQSDNGRWINVTTGHVLKAIQIVHQVGIPADIDAFAQLAKDFNVILIEDSACALGSTYKNKPIGSSGFMGALSFHPRKVITTGEGGILLLDNEEQAKTARMLRTHGMDTSDVVRHQAGSTTYESYPVVGYNYKLTDLQAALGLSQLSHIDAMLQRRHDIRQQYDAVFGTMPELTTIRPKSYVTFWNVQSYPIRLVNGNRTQRDTIMQALDHAGITTRRGIPSAHLEPAYDTGDYLPNTVMVSDTSIFLPIYPSLTNNDVHRIIAAVQTVVAQQKIMTAV